MFGLVNQDSEKIFSVCVQVQTQFKGRIRDKVSEVNVRNAIMDKHSAINAYICNHLCMAYQPTHTEKSFRNVITSN